MSKLYAVRVDRVKTRFISNGISSKYLNFHTRVLSVLQAPYKHLKVVNKHARRAVTSSEPINIFFSTSLLGVSDERYRYSALRMAERLGLVVF